MTINHLFYKSITLPPHDSREGEDEVEYGAFDEESSSLIKLNTQFVLYLLQVVICYDRVVIA